MMERVLENILPIMDVEHDLILSKQGDITIGFICELPEIFTLSNDEYEAFHQAWIKQLRYCLSKLSFISRIGFWIASIRPTS